MDRTALLVEDITAATRADPARRLSGAAELAERLERLDARVAERKETAARAERDRKAAEQARRLKTTRRLLAATAAVLVVVCGLAAYAWQQRNQKAAALVAEQQAREEAVQKGKEAAESLAARKALLWFVQYRIFALAQPKGQEGGMGRDVKLIDALRVALGHIDEAFNGKPLDEAYVRSSLGTTFSLLGETQVALEQDLIALRINQQNRGLDHTETLSSMMNVGVSYSQLGRHAEALEIRESTLDLSKKIRGPEHPETLKAMHNLGSTYQALGRHDDAVKLYGQTIKLRTKIIGPDSRQTLASMNNLANTLLALGRFTEAIKEHERVLGRRQVEFGPNDTDTLSSMHNLATAYDLAGNHAKALVYEQKSLDGRRQTLGPDHVETLQSLHGVAVINRKVGGLQNFQVAEMHLNELQERVSANAENLPAEWRTRPAFSFVQLYDSWGKQAEGDRWFAKLPAKEQTELAVERHDAWPLLWGWPRF